MIRKSSQYLLASTAILTSVYVSANTIQADTSISTNTPTLLSTKSHQSNLDEDIQAQEALIKDLQTQVSEAQKAVEKSEQTGAETNPKELDAKKAEVSSEITKLEKEISTSTDNLTAERDELALAQEAFDTA
ncbi:hypothetical protein ACVRY7_06665 [Streptococcus ictaluri]|uniref:Uncharacterized protein n=1 Tax=Streptococcus ictaluri 707-05 TaxID=764299 RepID=G5K545_9STRE|nr:hypothetical protein [Streptococcus ictaluri]EHI69012.1 hypothetical protein STRIC_1933 [Streptococcus ictaluri 707-05]